MTNEELFADLKQFIEATVSQQMADVATKDDIKHLDEKLSSDIKHLDEKLSSSIKHLDEKLSSDIKHLDEKIDTIQDAIAEALINSTETLDNTIQDHERRLLKLEHA